MAVVYVAGGCLWGVEAFFKRRFLELYIQKQEEQMEEVLN